MSGAFTSHRKSAPVAETETDEYAVWPCKFNGVKQKNLTRLRSTLNPQQFRSLKSLDQQDFMHKFAHDSQQIKNSISVDNKSRFNTSYGKCFDATKNPGEKKPSADSHYFTVNYKKAADALQAPAINKEVPFKEHRA